MSSSLFNFVVTFIFSTMICSISFCQSSSELIQNGLSSYQNGDYESALNSFNGALGNTGNAEQQEENILPLTGESQMESDSESKEVDDTESKMEYDTESKETYVSESQEQTVDVSTIQQY